MDESKVPLFSNRTDTNNYSPNSRCRRKPNPNHPRIRQRQIPTQPPPHNKPNSIPNNQQHPNGSVLTFFPNGTAYPTTITNGALNTVVVDPLTGHNAGWIPTCVVVRNDGTVPINVNATITDKNVPSNLDLTLNCGYYGTIAGDFGADKATTQQPIQPGQYYYMSLIAFLTPNTSNYQPDQQFSYSFDATVTATQA